MTYFSSRLFAAGAVSLMAIMDTAAAQDMIKLSVAVSPATVSAPVFIAQEDGIFAKHGLSVEIVTLQSGAEAIPNLMNGTLDIAMGDSVGSINAVMNRVPLKVVGAAIVAPEDPDLDFSAIMVKPGTIETLADVNGKTFAVHQQGGGAFLSALAAIDKAGGDARTVNFVEIPFPQIPPALAQGRVDVGFLTEPFVSMAAKAGMEVVSYPGAEGIPAVPLILYISTMQILGERGEAIAAFLDAVDEANAVALADPDHALEMVSKHTPIPAEILVGARLPTFPTKSTDLSSLASLVDYMVQYGVVRERPDLETVVWSAADR